MLRLTVYIALPASWFPHLICLLLRMCFREFFCELYTLLLLFFFSFFFAPPKFWNWVPNHPGPVSMPSFSLHEWVCVRDRTHGVAFVDCWFSVFQVTFASLHSGHCMADDLAKCKDEAVCGFLLHTAWLLLVGQIPFCCVPPYAFFSHFSSPVGFMAAGAGNQCYLSPPDLRIVVPPTSYPIQCCLIPPFSYTLALLLVCQVALQLVLLQGMKECCRGGSALCCKGVNKVFLGASILPACLIAVKTSAALRRVVPS